MAVESAAQLLLHNHLMGAARLQVSNERDTSNVLWMMLALHTGFIVHLSTM